MLIRSRPESSRHAVAIAVTLTIMLAGSMVVSAHDPGLSALEIRIAHGRAIATWSAALTDVSAAVGTRGRRSAQSAAELVGRSVHVTLDDRPVAYSVDSAEEDGNGIRVQLSFSVGSGSRLGVRSDMPGLAPAGHRQLVTVQSGDRVMASRLLDRESAGLSVDLDRAASGGQAFILFTGLGVHHILSGLDHLLFLGGLLLAARGVRELVVALSAFTAAHSLTIAGAALGWVHVTPALVEPLIALSIVYLGVEMLAGTPSRFALRRPGPPSRFALRRPRPGRGIRWVVVCAFGLVHGLGFAEALVDAGVGSTAAQMLVSLLSFNLGVELGQLLVVTAALPLMWTLRSRPLWRARVVPACSAVIAVAGGYWFVERVGAIW
jgi:hydrogenase/urease accessory protein HupE